MTASDGPDRVCTNRKMTRLIRPIPLMVPLLNGRQIELESIMAIQKPARDGSVVLEPQKAGVKPPPMYKVLLLNDDFTPMDFVVVVLEQFFAMTREQASVVMLKVHREGKGVCGVFPRDVAATKVDQVTAFARRHQHPLACVMEEN